MGRGAKKTVTPDRVLNGAQCPSRPRKTAFCAFPPKLGTEITRASHSSSTGFTLFLKKESSFFAHLLRTWQFVCTGISVTNTHKLTIALSPSLSLSLFFRRWQRGKTNWGKKRGGKRRRVTSLLSLLSPRGSSRILASGRTVSLPLRFPDF